MFQDKERYANLAVEKLVRFNVGAHPSRAHWQPGTRQSATPRDKWYSLFTRGWREGRAFDLSFGLSFSTLTLGRMNYGRSGPLSQNLAQK